MTSTLPRLLFPVVPWSDESIVNSYQIRVRAANRIGSLDHLSAVARMPKCSLSTFRLLTEPSASTCLGRMAGLEYDLASAAPRPLLGDGGHVIRWDKGSLSVQFWMHAKSQVCPDCLATKGYLPETLDFWHLPVCSEHECLLVDTCPKCRTPISSDRPVLCFCGNCGFDLRACPRQAVPSHLGAVADKLSRLCSVPLWTPHGEVALNASQIAALCAYFSSGEFSASLARKLSTAAEWASPERRLQALSVVSDCFHGDAIVAEEMKEAIIATTPCMEPFRGSTMFTYWLREAVRPLEIGVRALNAISLNVTDDVAHFALHQPGGEQYRVADNIALAKLFAVSQYELSELCRIRRLYKGGADDSYDADEVMELSEYRRAIWNESELDTNFGAPGLTSLLRGHRLIDVFATRADGPALFTPDSVITLLKRIQGATRLLPVKDAVARSKNRPTGAEVFNNIFGLLNGTATAVAWPAPYRLAELSVDVPKRCA